MTVVELDRLSKTLGSFNAVKSLDLKTEDGEFVVLVGPSGCGKTTTMRMSVGLEGATGGPDLTVGQPVRLGMQPDTLHEFHADSGRSVLAA
jgi:multiple sugar transport system ATP-binding protein